MAFSTKRGIQEKGGRAKGGPRLQFTPERRLEPEAEADLVLPGRECEVAAGFRRWELPRWGLVAVWWMRCERPVRLAACCGLPAAI